MNWIKSIRTPPKDRNIPPIRPASKAMAKNSCFRFPGFSAGMRRFRRYLEAIAWFNGAGWLTLNGNFEAPFQDVGRFNSRMCVSRYRHSGLYSRVYQ
jgi:hypothetical protein